MLFPITLAILVLIVTLLFIVKRNHDDITRRISFILEKYHHNILLKKSNVSCQSSTIGLKNGKYLFTKCDLIILKDAFVIISFREIFKYKLYSNLFFIENNFVMGHGELKKFNPNSFNGVVYIEFGEASFTSTSITIQLKHLKPEEKGLISI